MAQSGHKIVMIEAGSPSSREIAAFDADRKRLDKTDPMAIGFPQDNLVWAAWRGGDQLVLKKICLTGRRPPCVLEYRLQDHYISLMGGDAVE